MTAGITFIIKGPPVAWARSGHAGNRHYTKKKQADHMELVAAAALSMRPAGFVPPVGAIGIDIVVCFKASKKCERHHRPSAEGHYAWHPTKRRFDWDNCGKILCDSLIGVLYAEDGEIVDGRVRKVCGPEPFTSVTVQSLEG